MLLLLTDEISVYEVEVTFNGITYTPGSVKVELLVQKLKVAGPAEGRTSGLVITNGLVIT
jgi:hypothetical protein